MKNRAANLIAALSRMTRIQLLDRWRELYDKPAPAGMRRELIIPFLAYRLQENSEGGLSSGAKVMLKAAQRHLGCASRLSDRNPRPPMKPGTRVLRHWKGAVHEVDVMENGYRYAGNEYGSLSEIARKITGTRWSGPAFFGLKRTKAKPEQNHD
jgi:hypothetical protein